MNKKLEKDFQWAKRVVQSCQNEFQLKAARRVIDLFKEKYDDEEMVLDLLCLASDVETSLKVV